MMHNTIHFVHIETLFRQLYKQIGQTVCFIDYLLCF